MYKHLTGFTHNNPILRIFQSAFRHTALQPRIYPVYLPVQYERIQNAECQFNGYPQIKTAHVAYQCYLQENLDDIGRLKINSDYIVTLVGAQQGLPVINKITDESGSQKCKISKIDYSEANAGIGEYIGQEAGQKQSRTQNQQSYITIEISQYRNNLLYPVPISVENRFVKHIADGSSDAQLRQIEKAKQVLHRTRQPDKVRPQFLKKYLPGEKGDEKGDKVKEYIDTRIQIAFMEAGF